jgi:hypothetical protein
MYGRQTGGCNSRFVGKPEVTQHTRKSDSVPQASTTLWSEALIPHSAMNVGSEEIRIIAVELKTADAGTSP